MTLGTAPWIFGRGVGGNSDMVTDGIRNAVDGAGTLKSGFAVGRIEK